MKKTLSILLVAILACSTMAASASAATATTDSDESIAATTVDEAIESGEINFVDVPDDAEPSEDEEGYKTVQLSDVIMKEMPLTTDEGIESGKVHFIDVPDDAEPSEDGYWMIVNSEDI